MSGPEFRAASEGHTLYFETLDGEYFGAEQYHDDQRSTWLPREGQCIPGVWAATEDKICFLHYGEVACWRIYGANGDVTHADAADQGDTWFGHAVISRHESSNDPLIVQSPAEPAMGDAGPGGKTGQKGFRPRGITVRTRSYLPGER